MGRRLFLRCSRDNFGSRGGAELRIIGGGCGSKAIRRCGCSFGCPCSRSCSCVREVLHSFTVGLVAGVVKKQHLEGAEAMFVVKEGWFLILLVYFYGGGYIVRSAFVRVLFWLIHIFFQRQWLQLYSFGFWMFQFWRSFRWRAILAVFLRTVFWRLWPGFWVIRVWRFSDWFPQTVPDLCILWTR